MDNNHSPRLRLLPCTFALLLIASLSVLCGCSSLQSASEVLQETAETILGLPFTGDNSLKDRAETYLGFDLPENSTIKNENDLMPAIPDGYDYFEINIPADDQSFSQATAGWSTLPFSPNEQLFFFGTEDEYAADHYEVGILPNDGNSYYTGEDGHVYKRGKDGFFDSFTNRGEKTVPEGIVNGTYSLSVYETDIQGRYSDFVLRVYDSDASVLYIFSYAS